MRGETVAQGVGSNIDKICGERVMVNYCPGVLASKGLLLVEKKRGVDRAQAKSFSRAVLLDPFDSLARDRDLAFSVALTVAKEESGVQIKIAVTEGYGFRYAYSRCVQELEKRAIAESKICRSVGLA
ncbi:MAG TPA: hypothetical protein VK582_04865 [Pyrinomonadaceae bacterium]|nr:hypothetical protein [Pyrinomonadaceae bacterium]